MRLRFICTKCHRKQRLEVGIAYIIVKEDFTDPERILYSEEVKCRFCSSRTVELQPLEYMSLILLEEFYDESEVFFTHGMEVEGKAMPFSKVKPYIEKRIKQEPENGELRLRYANFLRRLNEYDKAITQYKKSLELNGNLLDSLLNLADIFYRRSVQYKEKGAMTKAREYFEKFVALFESGNANLTTLTDEKTILLIIEDRKEVLYPKKKKRKRKR